MSIQTDNMAETQYHCNGMICLGMKKKRYDDEYTHMVLWNPFTREHKTLSKTNANKKYFKDIYDGSRIYPIRMYYNSSEDDYKLLRVMKSHDVCIYSLKFDSWIKMESIARELFVILEF